MSGRAHHRRHHLAGVGDGGECGAELLASQGHYVEDRARGHRRRGTVCGLANTQFCGVYCLGGAGAFAKQQATALMYPITLLQHT